MKGQRHAPPLLRHAGMPCTHHPCVPCVRCSWRNIQGAMSFRFTSHGKQFLLYEGTCFETVTIIADGWSAGRNRRADQELRSHLPCWHLWGEVVKRNKAWASIWIQYDWWNPYQSDSPRQSEFQSMLIHDLILITCAGPRFQHHVWALRSLHLHVLLPVSESLFQVILLRGNSGHLSEDLRLSHSVTALPFWINKKRMFLSSMFRNKHIMIDLGKLNLINQICNFWLLMSQ